MAQFTLRSFDTILKDAADYFKGSSGVVTDFTEGSVIRTIMEATGVELSRLYYDMMVGLNDAQEQSSYITFGFPPLPSASAYGTVLFTLDVANSGQTSIIIPEGATVSVGGDSGYRYTILNSVTLSVNAPEGEAVVRAVIPGSLYNVASGAIDTYDSNNIGISVTNPRAFITGSDAETDLQRRQRFAVFLTGLPRATREAILYGVKSTAVIDPNGYIIEQVLKANTIEVGPGKIYLYIHNGVNGATQDLLDAAQKTLSGFRDASGVAYPGWKAAGIQSFVFPAEELPVAVDVTVEIAPGRIPDIVTTRVQQSVANIFSKLDVGEMLRIQDLLQAIRRIPGVLDIVSLNTPVTNIHTQYHQIAVPGDITVATLE